MPAAAFLFRPSLFDPPSSLIFNLARPPSVPYVKSSAPTPPSLRTGSNLSSATRHPTPVVQHVVPPTKTRPVPLSPARPLLSLPCPSPYFLVALCSLVATLCGGRPFPFPCPLLPFVCCPFLRRFLSAEQVRGGVAIDSAFPSVCTWWLCETRLRLEERTTAKAGQVSLAVVRSARENWPSPKVSSLVVPQPLVHPRSSTAAGQLSRLLSCKRVPAPRPSSSQLAPPPPPLSTPRLVSTSSKHGDAIPHALRRPRLRAPRARPRDRRGAHPVVGRAAGNHVADEADAARPGGHGEPRRKGCHLGRNGCVLVLPGAWTARIERPLAHPLPQVSPSAPSSPSWARPSRSRTRSSGHSTTA